MVIVNPCIRESKVGEKRKALLGSCGWREAEHYQEGGEHCVLKKRVLDKQKEMCPTVGEPKVETSTIL